MGENHNLSTSAKVRFIHLRSEGRLVAPTALAKLVNADLSGIKAGLILQTRVPLAASRSRRFEPGSHSSHRDEPLRAYRGVNQGSGIVQEHVWTMPTPHRGASGALFSTISRRQPRVVPAKKAAFRGWYGLLLQCFKISTSCMQRLRNQRLISCTCVKGLLRPLICMFISSFCFLFLLSSFPSKILCNQKNSTALTTHIHYTLKRYLFPNSHVRREFRISDSDYVAVPALTAARRAIGVRYLRFTASGSSHPPHSGHLSAQKSLRRPLVSFLFPPISNDDLQEVQSLPSCSVIHSRVPHHPEKLHLGALMPAKSTATFTSIHHPSCRK